MSIIENNINGPLRAKPTTKIGIVQSVYNREITDVLYKSCIEELKRAGVSEKNIHHMTVPGAFELPFGCLTLARTKKPDALIALGCVIRGETPHFDFIAKQCAAGIMDLNLKLELPIAFGVLTTDNLKQAKDRSKGGRRRDKGVEAAQTVLQLIHNLKSK